MKAIRQFIHKRCGGALILAEEHQIFIICDKCKDKWIVSVPIKKSPSWRTISNNEGTLIEAEPNK